MQHPSNPATRFEVVRIASRSFAAFLLFWAFLEISRLPSEVLNLFQNMQRISLSQTSFAVSSSIHYMMLGIIVDLICIVVWLFFARWFYRCDVDVQKFFYPDARD